MTWESGRNTACHFTASSMLNYNRASSDNRYFSDAGQNSNTSNYTDDIVNTGASFHPTRKLSLNVTENYTSNLNGYLAQNLSSNGTAEPGLSLGSGAHSSTLGGGATYQFTNNLTASAQATYYEQYLLWEELYRHLLERNGELWQTIPRYVHFLRIGDR